MRTLIYAYVVLRLYAKIVELERIVEDSPIEIVKEMIIVAINLACLILTIISHRRKINKIMMNKLIIFIT